MFITKAIAQSIVFGGGNQIWVPARSGRFSTSWSSLPENLISLSTSSGKALVTTELDVLVCNTFSSGGRTQCAPQKCDTSSCEVPPAETHRLKSLAPPPGGQEFSFKEKEKRFHFPGEKRLGHLAHCGTCGSVFVHLQSKKKLVSGQMCLLECFKFYD